jgi:hypothetical protein
MRYRLILAALIAALIPAVASAQTTEYNQCAVGWIAGPEYVVLTAHSTNQQALVNDAAAACAGLIASGAYMGADKYSDWRARGFSPICTVSFNGFEGMDVWAWPDLNSAAVGFATCQYWQNQGSRVRYW